ncbi:MAG: hypothetical protein ACLGHI_09650 [Gammaproteobacteria bacterium]|jgi:hypothetical protein
MPMFQQIARCTFLLLTFRAGPQDLPYLPQYTYRFCLAGGIPVFMVYSMALPPGLALVMAASTVLGMGLVTYLILRLRGLEPRFTQTFHALLASNGLLTLLMVPPFALVAPQIIELASNPDLLQDPQAARLPGGPVFLMNLLNLWNFAVTAGIFRHAANVAFGWGILLALLAAFSVLMVVLMLGILGGSLLGLGG